MRARRSAGQIVVAAFQKQPHVAHRRRVGFVGGQAFDARPQAAVDVILQAGIGMEARQIDLAGRHHEMAVDEVHQPVRQVAREVGAEVGGAVFPQAAGDVDARIFLAVSLM